MGVPLVDRTDEFRQILRSAAAGGDVPGMDKFVIAPQQQSELNVWCAGVGSEIHQSSLRVQELRKMARSRGIFNDKTTDINELAYSLKQDITRLSQKIEALQDRAHGSGPNKAYQAHTKNMVDALKTRLLEVANDLRDALNDRTKALDLQDSRRRMYRHRSQWEPASNPRWEPASNVLPSRVTGDPEDLEGGCGGPGQAVSTQYATSRVEAVQSVQKTIGELAQMFQKMAVMVTAQEDMIQRVDHDIDDMLSNVNEGHDHILKYFHRISPNRTLIIKILLILMLFVIFFVVFLA